MKVTRRLGNIRNELGMVYMNRASSATKGFGPATEAELALWKKSYTYFENGIKAFTVVDDR